jgi:rhodanese-related sulfurtransferase
VPSRTSTAAILLETLMVVAAAAGFAFATHQLSPRGLNLARDYYPRVASPAHPSVTVSPPARAQPASPREDSATADIDQRIKQDGFQPVSRAQMENFLHDPSYPQGMVIFVDARDPDHYAESHLPGAYPLDYYHPEKDLAVDLTPCAQADVVVVYCTSSECEDAENTALLLRSNGVPVQKLFVYGGGFNDWSEHQLPLEKGERNSGLAPAATK